MRFLILIFALSAHAQDQKLDGCVADQVKARGVSFEAQAFFSCRGVKVSEDVHARENLANLRQNWLPGSRLKYIEARAEANAIAYSANEDAYTIYLTDSEPLPVNLSREANPDHSTLRRISQETGISLRDQALTDEQLTVLDSAYVSLAFKAQGGTVVDIDFSTRGYGTHAFANLVSRGMILHLRSSSIEVGHLMRFLASPNAMINWLDRRKLTLTGNDFFDSQIDYLNKLKESDQPLPFANINLVESDSPRSISGACSASECSGLTLILTDDPPAGLEGLDRDFLSTNLISTLQFFVKKNVSIPHEISEVTYQNLKQISEKWSDNLRIRKIDLTRDDNSIDHAGISFLGGQYTRIHLNDSKLFKTYPQIINNYAFDK